MGGLGGRAEEPASGRLGCTLLQVCLGDVPHGGRPLIPPGGGGHGQVMPQGGDAVVPPAMEEVLPAQVVGVAVVLRLLPHRQLQQREVLPPGFGRVRVVIQLHPRRCHQGAGLPGPLPAQDLMDRVDPLVAVAAVDFLVPEHHTLSPIGPEGPGIAVPGLARVRRPGGLQSGPPAGTEHLVQVGTHADVCVLIHQLQGAVAGRVEPPGGDGLHRDGGSTGLQPGHGVVGGAGVQHHHPVRLPHGVHPAVHKPGLILADGIDYDLHGCASSLRKEGGGRLPSSPGFRSSSGRRPSDSE